MIFGDLKNPKGHMQSTKLAKPRFPPNDTNFPGSRNWAGVLFESVIYYINNFEGYFATFRIFLGNNSNFNLDST